MEIPLNLPHGQQQQEFIDYLNAGLQRLMANYTGYSGVVDGHLESNVTGLFPIDQEKINLI
jgi:hypothetical protein